MLKLDTVKKLFGIKPREIEATSDVTWQQSNLTLTSGDSEPQRLSLFASDRDLIDKIPEILGGDKEYQEIYLLRRTFAPVLSGWFRDVAYGIARECFDATDTSSLNGKAGPGTRFKLKSKFNDDMFLDLNLDSYATFASLNAKIKNCQNNRYDESLVNLLSQAAPLSRDTAISIYFSPDRHTAFGYQALQAITKIAPLCLKAQLLEDFLTHHEVNLNDTLKLKIFREIQDPWDLLNVSTVRKVVELKSVISAMRPEYGMNEVARDIQAFLYQGSAAERLLLRYEEQDRVRYDSINLQTRSEPVSSSAKGESTPDTTVNKSEISELKEIIAGQISNAQVAQDVARSLVKLSRIAGITFDDIKNRLLNGEEARTVLQDTHAAWKKLRGDTKHRQADYQSANESVSGNEVLKERCVECRILSQNGRSGFEQWLNRLDPTFQLQIKAAIDNFSYGNFGDSERVGSGVWKLKLNNHLVFYGFTAPGQILIISGGMIDKNIEYSDVEGAVSALAEYRANITAPIKFIK